MDEKTKTVDEQAQKLKDSVSKIAELEKVTELLSKNEFEFDYKEQKYKVVKANFKDIQEANTKRVEKYTELLKNEKYLLEDDLIALYKKRGTDVKGLDSQMFSLEKQKEDYWFQLGKAIKDKQPENELEILKKEIEKIQKEIQTLVAKKAVLLESSIETQVNVYVFTYIAYLTMLKKEGDKWVKAWEKYDDYINADEDLVNLSVFYTSLFPKMPVPSL